MVAFVVGIDDEVLEHELGVYHDDADCMLAGWHTEGVVEPTEVVEDFGAAWLLTSVDMASEGEAAALGLGLEDFQGSWGQVL